jgi:hypothetical protein
MFCQLLPHIRNCCKLLIIAPKTAATALACSHKPTAYCQHTCCQRNCLACLGPSAVQVIVSPCCRFCRHCRSHQCCRIPHCPICVIPALFRQALGNSRPSPNSRQHTALLAVVCCRTHSVDFCYYHAGCHPVATVQQ